MAMILLMLACGWDLPRLGPLPRSTALAGCPAPSLPPAPSVPPTLADDVRATPVLPDRSMFGFARIQHQQVEDGGAWRPLPEDDLSRWSTRFGSLGAGDPRSGVLVCVGTSREGVATRIEVTAGQNPRFASDFEGEPGLPLVAVPGVVLAPGDAVTVELFGETPRVSLGAAAVEVTDLMQPINLRSASVTAACRVGVADEAPLASAVRTFEGVRCDATIDAAQRDFGSPYQLEHVRAYAEAAAAELGWADPRLQALLAAADVQERSFAAATAPLVAELSSGLSEHADVGLVRGTFRFTCDSAPIPGASGPAGACFVVGDLVADAALSIDRGGIHRAHSDPDVVLHTVGVVWPTGTQAFMVPSFVSIAGATPIQVDNRLTNDVHGPVVVDVPDGATLRVVFVPVVRVPVDPPAMVQIMSPGMVVARVRPAP